MATARGYGSPAKAESRYGDGASAATRDLPENIEGHESRSFASSFAEASEDGSLRACPELQGIT